MAIWRALQVPWGYGDDWEVSTPAAEGLDPDRIAELYCHATKLDSIYSLLIIRNGKLIAEKYFGDGSIDLKSNLQSVGKSYTSALVGIAFDQGCLTNVADFIASLPSE